MESFDVPCVVADNFLKLATGGQIKVLLYLLRFSERKCTEEEISANTGVSIAEVADAVLFWQNANIFMPRQNDTDDIIENTAEKKKLRKNLMPTAIEKMTKEMPDLHRLFIHVESILGTLNPSWQNLLIWIYNNLGLDYETIVTLIGYCKGNNKAKLGYVETMAQSWADDGINTLELAQKEVQRLTDLNQSSGRNISKTKKKKFDVKKYEEICVNNYEVI
ncbi:MAG: DnaD domain protein [Ruminococcus sp.]|nr:DnaD domain protein [Ruminococcus sp.]